MNNVVIKVSNVTKIYHLYDKPQDRLKEALHPLRKLYSEDFYALKDINFEIRKGERIGIVGKNGAGKSTLLKIIAGVLTPSSGEIKVQGKISSLLELGAGFNPEMTGFDNIYFHGTIMGFSKEEIDNKLDDIINFADIGEFIYQPVKSYSSGMFARLAFSVAVSVEPDILIVDEALSVGDMFFVEKCINKINSIIGNKTTLIFVSHDLTTMKRVVNRCILLKEGKVKYDDDILFVLNKYQNNAYEIQQNRAINLNQISNKFSWGENLTRFGTGRIIINSLMINNQLLGFNESVIVHTHEDILLNICFTNINLNKHTPINFTFALFNKDGLLICSGSQNLKQKQLFSDNIAINCHIKDFSLLGGVYFLSIGLWDNKTIVPYDLHERCYLIEVISKDNAEDGIVLLDYFFD